MYLDVKKHIRLNGSSNLWFSCLEVIIQHVSYANIFRGVQATNKVRLMYLEAKIQKGRDGWGIYGSKSNE